MILAPGGRFLELYFLSIIDVVLTLDYRCLKPIGCYGELCVFLCSIWELKCGQFLLAKNCVLIFQKCLHTDPDRRPLCAELLSHTFFQADKFAERYGASACRPGWGGSAVRLPAW